MRSPKLRGVLLASLFVVSGPLAFAQSAKPTADPAQPKAASEEEVQQLRREVAELKAQLQRLVQASTQPQAGGGAHLVQTNAITDPVQPDSSATPAPATTE